MLNVGRPDPFSAAAGSNSLVYKSELLPAAEISCQTPRMRTWSTHAREKIADVCIFAGFLLSIHGVSDSFVAGGPPAVSVLRVRMSLSQGYRVPAGR